MPPSASFTLPCLVALMPGAEKILVLADCLAASLAAADRSHSTGVSDLLGKVVTPHHTLRNVAVNNTLCMVKIGHSDIFNILHIRRQTYEHADIPKLT